jgi:F-type H+-transporting ATPase subunit gamma
MFSRKEYSENRDAVSSIKSITSIYQEIALLRINQLKEGVASLREFLNGVAEVYTHAKSAYISSLKQRSLKKKDLNSLSFIKRNGKTVLVFLSANEHLYGNIVLDVWHEFLADLKKDHDDGVVVGGFGRYLMKDEHLSNSLSYFDLNDDKPTQEEIKRITEFIGKYEEIIVYYGELISVLNQEPSKAQISGGVTLESNVVSAKSYLFEPSPEKIMEFFETDIIATLFTQKVYEHQLARFGARMVAMDQATENAKEYLEKLNRDFRTLRKKIDNTKQLQIFAGVGLWEKNKNE